MKSKECISRLKMNRDWIMYFRFNFAPLEKSYQLVPLLCADDIGMVNLLHAWVSGRYANHRAID